jgi:hypothetical protein
VLARAWAFKSPSDTTLELTEVVAIWRP